MANPLEILKSSGVKKKADNSAITELITRAFTTRNLLHFAHWSTKSLAQHLAVGDLYDQIIDTIDDIVECYQGKNGLLSGLRCPAVEMPSDIVAHVRSEMDWVEANRDRISGGNNSIGNLVDSLTGHYQKCVYKLENLH